MVYLWGLLAAHRAGVPDGDGRRRSRDPGDHEAAGEPRRHRARRVWWRGSCGRGRGGRSRRVSAILLHPAVIDVSAWWGQYESIYVLFGLVAYLLAVRGHSLPAAAVLAVALMTKPQALPFLVPFAAWFLARDGWLGAVKAAAVGAAVIVAAVGCRSSRAGGPAGYARNLGEYQGDIFAILSIRAWNVWWLVQELLAGGNFVSDQGAILGPIDAAACRLRASRASSSSSCSSPSCGRRRRGRLRSGWRRRSSSRSCS